MVGVSMRQLNRPSRLIDLAGFLTLGAIFFVVLIPFFGIREVARAVGGQALWDLFFTGRTQTFHLVED